jgi:quercetin dioxygenase-like cupin family protein
MESKMKLPLTILWVCGVLTLWASQAQAEQPAPDSHRGLDVQVMQVVELGPEIEGMDGRQLRLRKLTIAPGGHIALHSHKNRPAVAYVLEGTTTVTFGDGTVRRFSAGDSISADGKTTHWHQNNGEENAVVMTADVYQAAK